MSVLKLSGVLSLCLLLAASTIGHSFDAPFDFAPATELTLPVSVEMFSPSLSSDGLTLFLTLDESPGGQGDYDIWTTSRPTRFGSFGPLVNLGPVVNSSSIDGGASISPDGLSLFFASTRPGGLGLRDLYVAKRATMNDPFEDPTSLGDDVNSEFDDASPFISDDGLTLAFSREVPLGNSEQGLYIATRSSTSDAFGEAEDLRPAINGFIGQGSPSLTADGLNLFYAAYDGSDTDLFVSTRASLFDSWGAPVNLGPNVNSTSIDDFGEFARDGMSIVFLSDRTGDVRLYEAAVVPEPIVSGDFNANGVLDSGDINDLTTQSADGTNPAAYDLNADTLVNIADVNLWVKDLFHSWVGDANLDKEFNSSDLVTVLAAGTYEADVAATWSTGDFDGSGRFNSGDLVAALADGGYEMGPRPAAAAVPEPGAWILSWLAIVCVSRRHRRLW